MKKFSKTINQESAVWMNNGWNGYAEFKMKSEILLHVPILKIKVFSFKLIQKSGPCSLSLSCSWGRKQQKFRNLSFVIFFFSILEAKQVALPWFYCLRASFSDNTVQGLDFYFISRKVALCLGRCSQVDFQFIRANISISALKSAIFLKNEIKYVYSKTCSTEVYTIWGLLEIEFLCHSEQSMEHFHFPKKVPLFPVSLSILWFLNTGNHCCGFCAFSQMWLLLYFI